MKLNQAESRPREANPDVSSRMENYPQTEQANGAQEIQSPHPAQNATIPPYPYTAAGQSASFIGNAPQPQVQPADLYQPQGQGIQMTETQAPQNTSQTIPYQQVNFQQPTYPAIEEGVSSPATSWHPQMQGNPGNSYHYPTQSVQPAQHYQPAPHPLYGQQSANVIYQQPFSPTSSMGMGGADSYEAFAQPVGQGVQPGYSYPEQVSSQQPMANRSEISADYTHIYRRTRIAVYDDMLSSPRIVDIEPNETKAYIADAASTTYRLAKDAGGNIPYTVILELVENFIHASFIESVITILDHGNTIRFSDQGPGIEKKSLAQQPGITSATAPMKEYIRGVGSGFPIVRSYLEVQRGRLLIEDNINKGTVITISIHPFAGASDIKTVISNEPPDEPVSELPKVNERQLAILYLCDEQESIRLTDVVKELNYANSSVYKMLNELMEKNLIARDQNSKVKNYRLTELGHKLLKSQ